MPIILYVSFFEEGRTPRSLLRIFYVNIEPQRVHAINFAYINFLPTICLAVIALQIKWKYSDECFPFSKQTSHVTGSSSDIVKRLSKFFFSYQKLGIDCPTFMETAS